MSTSPAKRLAQGRGADIDTRCCDPESTERALVVRVAGKDREAFRSLYQLYYLRLYGFLLRLTRQAEAAEEVLNDVMFVVWQKAPTFNGRSRVSTWIMGIAYRKGLNALGQTKRRVSTVQADENELLNALDMNPEVDKEELWDWLEKGLQRLSPEHRLVVELTHFLGYSYQEIAEVADCPVGTVKTRMFHARKQLRDVLTQLSGSPSDALQCSHENN